MVALKNPKRFFLLFQEFFYIVFGLESNACCLLKSKT